MHFKRKSIKKLIQLLRIWNY